MIPKAETNKRFCWIGGKDVDLEHCTTDEQDLIRSQTLPR